MPEVIPPLHMLPPLPIIPGVPRLERLKALLHVRVVIVDKLSHGVHQVGVLAGTGVPAVTLGRV